MLQSPIVPYLPSLGKENAIVFYITSRSVLITLFVLFWCRWITSQPLIITEFDRSLPQDDENKEQREEELKKKRTEYLLAPYKGMKGLPMQVACLSVYLLKNYCQSIYLHNSWRQQ